MMGKCSIQSLVEGAGYNKNKQNNKKNPTQLTKQTQQPKAVCF